MKSIRTRLLAAITIIVVVSGLAISQAIIHHYRTSLYDNAVREAKISAQNLALNAADMVLINDIVALQRLLNDRVRNDPAVAYLFVIHEGTILAHTFQAGVPTGLIRTGEHTETEPGGLRRIQSTEGHRYLDVSSPISDGRAGVLHLGYSEASLSRQVFRLWVHASLLTTGFLSLALVAGALLVRQITRPLISLAKVAEHVDESHLDVTIPAKTDDEVGKLAGAFQQMLRRLQSSMQQLALSNTMLEEKNANLERAHRQTRTLFEITKSISALAGLMEICTFLSGRLGDILRSDAIAMVLFPGPEEAPLFFSKGICRPLEPEEYASLEKRFNCHDDYCFCAPRDLPDMSEDFFNAPRIAVFPIRSQDRLIGVFLAGCTAECQCLDPELQVIRMVLDQSSGAVFRALAQETEMRHLRNRVEKGAGFAGLIGKTPEMQVIYKLIEDVAGSDATVLIEGESGTGKEMVARAIHEKSPRKEKPFVVIKCSAYPATLLESELFGHEKGAFTGAIRQKAGRFEQADGGTIFLDEVGDIPPQAQVKLLRVIQNRKFERVGADTTLSVDIRILAATNKRLLQEVKAGRFREDLFYRLNVIPVHLPPLRERPNDIPYLARHFLGRYNEIQGKSIRDFDPEAMRRLMEYHWPGNVRELENTIEHAVVLARGNCIVLSDFPSFFTKNPLPAKTGHPSPDSFTGPDATLEDTEKTHLVEMLTACNWNKKDAARRLGIGRSTLYAKLKRHGIKGPPA